MKIGDKVISSYGTGVIVGIDLPDSWHPRFIVEVTEPVNSDEKNHTVEWLKNKLCFFPFELTSA